MNIVHSTAGDRQTDKTTTFSVHIYPPRDPNYRFNSVDANGDKFDYYLVIDKKPYWAKDYTRTIKHGWTTITKKKQNADPYSKEIVDYINQTYPITQ